MEKIQKGCGVMNTKEISGRRQMEFLAGFDFVREAGTVGEVKAAKMIRDTLDSFGVKNRMEVVCSFGFFGSTERCLRLWSLIRRSMW